MYDTAVRYDRALLRLVRGCGSARHSQQSAVGLEALEAEEEEEEEDALILTMNTYYRGGNRADHVLLL